MTILRKVIYVYFTSMFALFACNESQKKEDAQLKETAAQEKKARRFFSDTSFWNQPIPDNPEIDPRTGKWIEMLKQEPTGEHFGITCNQWTVPVYEVDEYTPYVQVNLHYLKAHEFDTWQPVQDHKHFGHGPDFNPVPIPKGAMPDPEGDAHFAVVDWNRMLAWDMWALRKLEDGTWESNTGMVYRLDGDGVFDYEKLGFVDGESCHFYGPSRAAAVPVIAGLIRYDEVMAGEIRHKLSCASRYAGYKEFTYPAAWTDGFTEGGIPEGAVIQLDPELDLGMFNLTPEEIVVAKALQEYGMVVVDVAGGQPIYAEGLYHDPDRTWDGKLREWEDTAGINSIPFDHYRVLKIKEPVYKGDARSRHKSYWNDED